MQFCQFDRKILSTSIAPSRQISYTFCRERADATLVIPPSLRLEEGCVEPAIFPYLNSEMSCEVTHLVPCTVDELVQRGSENSWAQGFAAVDWLSRREIGRASCRER